MQFKTLAVSTVMEFQEYSLLFFYTCTYVLLMYYIKLLFKIICISLLNLTDIFTKDIVFMDQGFFNVHKA